MKHHNPYDRPSHQFWSVCGQVFQLKAKAQGDDETMDLDEDYLKSMEQGMPPISGLGVGIDRLMMLLYNAESVRDVVLFPMMKPIKD